MRSHLVRPVSFGVLIPITLAVVSISAAWIGYRAKQLGGEASGASRTVIIESVKRNAASAESNLFVSQETLVLRRYIAVEAEGKALAGSDSEAAKVISASLTKYVVPLFAASADLVKNTKYRTAAGTYDLDARLRDVGQVQTLDPAAAFKKADSAESQQRWMAGVSVIMTLPLFWMTLAGLTAGRVRRWSYCAGVFLLACSILMYTTIEFGSIA